MMFGSIFDTYHGVPILYCNTTNLGSFFVKFKLFGTFLGIVELHL